MAVSEMTFNLGQRDEQLATACEIANRDADVTLIEREFDHLNDEVVAGRKSARR
jgi:hypothetical protein